MKDMAMNGEVLTEINRARTNPAKYARNLQAMLGRFEGKVYRVEGRPGLVTKEGPKAVKEAIDTLLRTTPLPMLTGCEGLSWAAQVHCSDTGSNGITGHTGSDGSTPFQRMNRFGKWEITAAENCAYGGRSAEEHVQQLLIDDGVSSRGHRRSILNPKLAVVGIACGPHTGYGTTCVQCFAGGYHDKQSGKGGRRPQRPPPIDRQKLPSREQGEAAAKIQNMLRCRAAKKLRESMIEDRDEAKKPGVSIVEAAGVVTEDIVKAMEPLPEEWKRHALVALRTQPRKTVRVRTGNGKVVGKLWGNGSASTVTVFKLAS